jgi:hypothetical protein
MTTDTKPRAHSGYPSHAYNHLPRNIQPMQEPRRWTRWLGRIGR